MHEKEKYYFNLVGLELTYLAFLALSFGFDDVVLFRLAIVDDRAG